MTNWDVFFVLSLDHFNPIKWIQLAVAISGFSHNASD